MNEWLLLLLGVLLTVGTALFVAAEFALVALDRPQIKRAVEAGERGAKSVLKSHRSLSTQLSASQVGITLTTLVLGYIASPAIGAPLSGPLAALGLSESVARSVANVAAMIIVTVFSMIVGEMVPKTFAVSIPMRTAKVVAGPVRAFATVFRPLIAVLNGSANVVLRAMNIEPQEELSAARSPVELASLIRSSAEAGTLDVGTARLVTASIRFGNQTAQDVMTPRSQATPVKRTATARDVVELSRETGHSRFPVMSGDWDDIDGMVHIKSAVAVPYERRADVPVSALMVDPVFVPETIGLDPLLEELRSAGIQMAVVVDEYGGTSGVVTFEDVVEELVGEVSDEHDRARTTGRRLRDGSWTVPGMWRPDEVRRRLGADIPEDRAYETVGGWVMSTLERLPEVGDVLEVPGWSVRVIDMDGHRVDRLRFTPVADAKPKSKSEHEDGES